MRFSILSFVAAAFVASAPLAVAAPSALGGMNQGGSPAIIHVDKRCGEHAHFVPRHRNHAGHWVRGRCIPDHR